MNRFRAAASVFLFAIAVVPLSNAVADSRPGGWDIAKDPSVRTRWLLHAKAREFLALDSRLRAPSMRTALAERAVAMLEEARASESTDPVLRFDLGEAYERIGRHDRAIAVLESAIRLNPNHPGIADALATVAYAYAKLGRSEDETRVYEKYLTLVTDDRVRATALLNLAEARMHLGDLDQAIADYQHALQTARAAPSSASAYETATLAIWGLAVAYDRAGAHTTALGYAERAIIDGGEQLIAHSPNVFFIPEYERSWYLALAAAARAKLAREPRAQAIYANNAYTEWATYVREGSVQSPPDRWLSIAKRQLARAEKERVAAEANARKAAPNEPAPAR